MNWLQPLLPVLIEHVALPALLALGAWILTRVPGPVRDWLQSGTHQRDMALLLGALVRGALVLLPQLLSGSLTREGAAQLVAQYVRDNLPDTLRKLGPSDDTLITMATAAIEQVKTKAVPQ